jgi:hypothetical protein
MASAIWATFCFKQCYYQYSIFYHPKLFSGHYFRLNAAIYFTLVCGVSGKGRRKYPEVELADAGARAVKHTLIMVATSVAF